MVLPKTAHILRLRAICTITTKGHKKFSSFQNNHHKIPVFCKSSIEPSSNYCLSFQQNTGLIRRSLVPVLQLSASQICLSHHFMAGHSHWQNTRHIKAGKDAIKNIATNKICHKIHLAIREGSDNPKYNSALAKAIEEGKQWNVPQVTMENAIKHGITIKNSAQDFYVEVRGPLRTWTIIHAFHEHQKRVKDKIQNMVRRFGGAVGNTGTASHAFDQKGIVCVEVSGETKITLDQATDIAIDVGAEEAEELFHDSEADKMGFQFVCDPMHLHAVRLAIEKKDLPVVEAYQGFIPLTHAMLDEQGMEIIDSMLNMVQEHEAVVRIFCNAKPQLAAESKTAVR